MAKVINFAFFRKNCKTCEKALTFLQSIKISLPTNTEDARKIKKTQEEMIELAQKHKKIVSIKGKKAIEINIKNEEVTPAAILGLLVGPSGNLRAPTISVGPTLVIGFDPETYANYLK